VAKTSRDARRHIRAISEFFAAGKAVTEAAVNDFIGTYKKRKFLKQSLRRLIEKGLVEKKNNKFVPTLAGIRFFRSNIERSLKPKNWDGKWYLLSFDVPVKLNVKRDYLRRVLKSYDFYPLQKSVWVGPNKFGDDLWEFVVQKELNKYCRVMVVSVLEGDEDLKKYFKIGF